MNSKIYELLKKDLKNARSKDENIEITNGLNDIIYTTDNLYKVYNNQVTDEDIKMVIANTYVNKLNDLMYKAHMEQENELDDLEQQIEIYKKYFKDEEEAREYSLKDAYTFGSVAECDRIVKFVNKDKNSLATAFNSCAIILIIFGFIGSIVLGTTYYSFLIFIISLISVLFSALILFGLAELFQMLHDIRKKLYLQR